MVGRDPASTKSVKEFFLEEGHWRILRAEETENMGLVGRLCCLCQAPKQGAHFLQDTQLFEGLASQWASPQAV